MSAIPSNHNFATINLVPFAYLIALAFGLGPSIARSQEQDRWNAVSGESKVDILDRGELVTTYHFRSGSKPILWPLMGPDSKSFSRSYPMVADSKDEEHDHPHHRSLWMTFGEVNGSDLWAEGKGKGTVCHEGAPVIQSGKDFLTLQAKHVWKSGRPDVSSVSSELSAGCVAGAETLLNCSAVYTFRGTADERWIDCSYRLTAEQDIHFGDTKEGMFAIRVPEPMRADKRGGSILSSEGKKNDSAWGHPARWIDYCGKVQADDDSRYGIAILIHPNSYSAEGRWHVRTYGLFAHNPFGVKDFPKLDRPSSAEKTGGHALGKGNSIQLHYRVILHRGAFDIDTGNARWSEFAKTNP